MRNKAWHRRLRLAGAALLLLGGSAAARADDAAQAPQLEAQIRAWLAGVLGPHVTLDERPVHLTPSGGAYAMEIPLAGPLGTTGVAIDAPPVTATVRSLSAGIWALDDIRLPSPLHLRYAAPSGGEMQGEWTLAIEQQESHARLDPTLATESTWDATLHGYSNVFSGPSGKRQTSIGTIVGHAAWQPAGEGRINIVSDSTGELLATNATTKKGLVVSFTAAETHATAHFDGVAPASLPPILQAAFDVAPMAANAAHDPAGTAASALAGAAKPASLLPADTRATMRTALQAAATLLTGFGEEATFKDVHWKMGAIEASAQKFAAKFDMAEPAGRLALGLRIALDGAASNAIPPGPLSDLLPHHFAIAPRIGGVPSEGLHSLLTNALDDNAKGGTLQQQAMALLQDGPLTVGLDELAADFGPATVQGKGEVQIASPEAITGTAHVRATGLDKLIQLAGKVHELKQALPVLFMLKGLGRQDGDATVWDVDYRGGKLTVNGTDLSQMAPH